MFTNRLGTINSTLGNIEPGQLLQYYSDSLSQSIAFAQTITTQHNINNTLSQSLSFSQTITARHSHANSISQSLTFTQTITPQRTHNKTISQSLVFNPILTTHYHPNITYTDRLSFTQTISTAGQQLILNTRSRQSFILPNNIKINVRDESFGGHKKSIYAHTLQFAIPRNDLSRFKYFLNYYRNDPFIIDNKLAYLRNGNHKALDQFDNDPNITLYVDVLDGKLQ